MSIAERAENASKRILTDGFTVFTEVFNDSEMAALAEELERSNLPRSKAGIRHAMKHRGIAALARERRFFESRER